MDTFKTTGNDVLRPGGFALCSCTTPEDAEHLATALNTLQGMYWCDGTDGGTVQPLIESLSRSKIDWAGA